MELRLLRYFLAVAREETISGAAQALHLSQPSLSRQLMDLEAELGKQLFLRGNRRITLTEEGELLRRRAAEILSLVEKTEAELQDSTETITGDIYIGGGETEAMRLIAKTAKRLRTEYPGIRFHLYSGNADDVMERLDKGLLDFGLVIEPFHKKNYHFIQLLSTDTWGILMRKDSPLAQKESIRAEDLWELPLLTSRQSMMMDELPGWMEKQMDELTIVSTYNLIFNAALWVEEGLGYALCIDKLVHTDETSPLCFRPLEPRQEVGIDLVWKKYQVFSKAAQKFLDYLQIEKEEHQKKHR